MKNVFKAVLFMLFLVLSSAIAMANVITPIPNQAVNEGSLLMVGITATAPAPAPSTFGICRVISPATTCAATAVPQIVVGTTTVNFSKISDTLAQFNWTPDFTQSGTYTFNVSVSDAASSTNSAFNVVVNNVPPTLSVPATFVLGSDTQERSNPNHQTDSRQEINVTGTLTITNIGEPVSGLTGTATLASGFSASDLLLNFSLPKTSLASGESIAIPVSMRVPQHLDAVSNTLSPVSVKVASLTFNAVSATLAPVTATTELDLKAENNLRIKSAKIRFATKSESIRNGDTVQDMKPGDVIELELQLENRFTTRQEVSIEDVEVTALSGSNLNIDESADAGDLAAGETETITLTSVIDSNADDGTFDIELTVDGTDEFGARHGERWIVGFEVKRKNHEIAITRLSLDPQPVTCERSTTLTVDVRNIGRRDEDDVFIKVAAPDLGFGTVSDKLSINQDDEESQTFNIALPANLSAGNYRVTVDTFYNTNTKSNSDGVLLNAQGCRPAVVAPPVTQPPVTVITVPPPAANVTAPPTTPAAKPFFQTPQYLVLLALGYVVVIGGGAALIIKLLRKQ